MDEQIKNAVRLLNEKVINIKNCFWYDEHIYKVSLNDQGWYIAEDDEQGALDNLADYLEDKGELKPFVFPESVINKMSDEEYETITNKSTVIGNNCRVLYSDVTLNIECIL